MAAGVKNSSMKEFSNMTASLNFLWRINLKYWVLIFLVMGFFSLSLESQRIREALYFIEFLYAFLMFALNFLEKRIKARVTAKADVTRR